MYLSGYEHSFIASQDYTRKEVKPMAEQDTWALEEDDDTNDEAQPVELSEAALRAHEQAIHVLLEDSQNPNVRSGFVKLIVTFIDQDLGDVVGMWNRPPTGPHKDKIALRFMSPLSAMTDAVIQANLRILQSRRTDKDTARRLAPRRTPRAPVPAPTQPTPEVEETLSTIQRLRESMGGK